MSEQHADQGFRKLGATMKGMTPSQRWQYFKDYYLGLTVGLIIAAVLLVTLLWSILAPEPEVLVNGITVNVSVTEQLRTELTEALASSLGGNEQQTATLRSAYTTDTAVGLTGVMVQLAAGDLDYILTDGEGKDYFLQTEAFVDLGQMLTDGQMEELSDRLVYQQLEDGTNLPVALELTGMDIAGACTTGDGRLYLFFVDQTERADCFAAVLEYLLNWKA